MNPGDVNPGTLMLPDYKLIPCTRGSVPVLRPLYDLAGSQSMAAQIIGKVDSHLRLSGGWFWFNGRAREADLFDGAHPLLYVQMWNRGKVYRSLAFRDIGFVGVLNIEVKEGNRSKRRFADYLGAIIDGMRQNTLTMEWDSPAYCLGLVDGELLRVGLPWRA